MVYLGSTINLFKNNYLIKYVRIDNKGITSHCNGGNTYPNYVVTAKEFRHVWVNPNGVSNILSLEEFSKKFNVTYECGPKGGLFVVEINHNNIYVKKYSQGLYMHNTSKCKLEIVNTDE